MSNIEKNLPSASVISKEAGLVVFGAATGLLLSGAIGAHARKPLGFILGAAGIAAAGPELKKLADKLMNSPSTSRGSQKTLENIRYSAGKPIENVEYLEEAQGENMFIG